MFIKLQNPKNTIKTIATIAIAIGGVMISKVAEAITINITYAPGTTQEQITAVEMAKNIVSSYITDDDDDDNDNEDTINIHVGMNISMNTDYLALATPALLTKGNYGQFVKILGLENKKYKLLKRGNKIGESDQFSNADKIMLTTANAKVIDYKMKAPKVYNGLDGYVQFNNNVPWHYNYTQNTPTDKYDMTTIAMHEIFHVLGVISGIDPSNIKEPLPTTLDLFRYSEESLSQGAVDFRQGAKTYLSIDFSGKNSGKYFSTGVNPSLGGDGYQTSHWQNNPGSPTGIMNPTQYKGQKLGPSDADLMLLRVIGYDINTSAAVDLTALYDQAQTQATSAKIIDQTTAVAEMIKKSGVYETDGSGGTDGGGWWEKAEEHHQDHNH